MRTTLQHQIFKALGEYSQETSEKWLLDWPGQVILAVSQILWTKSITKALQSNSSNQQGLKYLFIHLNG